MNRKQTGSGSYRELLCLYFFAFMMISSVSTLSSQNLPTDEVYEEQIRIQQLLFGSKHSLLSNRPVWKNVYLAYLNEGELNHGIWTESHINRLNRNDESIFRFGIYNPQTRVTINTTHPNGTNNESAWYGRGLNSEITGGFWISNDYLTVTFRPQIVSQQNRNFEPPRFLLSDETGNLLYNAEALGETIDLPYRFGADSYQTYSLGYSSIRLHYKQLETGFSTEPLSWGPNVNYPLLLSNNAPGLNHFFLGTRAPIHIPYLGRFEFSLIGAFPEDSDYFILDEDEKMNQRFMSGINISFSPQISPNLHFGFARNIHTYLGDDGFKLSDLGMLLDPFYLEEFIRIRGNLNTIKPRNHLNSVYARWIWPENQFEIYGEFYREDFAWDTRDFLMEPRHNSGYAFGLQKLIFAPFAQFYLLNVEFTNMTPSYLQEVRRQDYYYTHPEIRQGHTNRGQLLGAAIGPGSNSQIIRLDAYKEWGKIGLFTQRLADNNHFHYQFDRSLNRPEEFRGGFGDYWRNRTDLTIGLNGLIYMNQLRISGKVSWTKYFNYGRFDYGSFGGINVSNFTPYDSTNLQIQMSVTYLF